MNTALYLATQDLRLDDNPALLAASQAQRLLCAHLLVQAQCRPNRYGLHSLGGRRWTFLDAALSDLDQSLGRLGQQLHRLYDEAALVQLIRHAGVDTLVTQRAIGWEEQQLLVRLQREFPALSILQIDGYTLYHADDAPWLTGKLPKQYTPFRYKAEALGPRSPLPAPAKLPPPPGSIGPLLQGNQNKPDWLPRPLDTGVFTGGEYQGRRHLDDYLSGNAPHHYKQTRNALEGWYTSAKWSPWLNLGCLSVRRVVQQLQEYEAQYGGNDSTHWLKVELLWREYFQWSALKFGRKLYAFQGVAKSAPLTSFYPQRFQAWCRGNTPFPLVNACMNELAQTGYLSNRGRQIVASCLVNELGLDWRYGAAWFEQQLLDYDVGVNWGNWQYIAGVGVDPRGGRHFDLAKQTEIYDGDGRYRAKWGGEALPLDSQDAADWPLAPTSP